MPEVELPLNLPVSLSATNGNVSGASILVIDDEAGIRESLEVLLTLEGYSVTMAVDGEEGLRTLDADWNCCPRSRSASPSCRSS